MIPILCNSCDAYIYDMDPRLLSWPLTFEMFTPASPNVKLPRGPIHTDFFCPVCFGPPVHWNAGTGKMGEWLKVRGSDGRPTIIKTSDLIEKWKDVSRVKSAAPTPPEPPPAAPASQSQAADSPPRSEKRASSKPRKKPGRKLKSAIISIVPPELIAQVEGNENENASLEASPQEFAAMKREQDRERDALERDKTHRLLRPSTG